MHVTTRISTCHFTCAQTLERIPEDRLGADSGLDMLWCGLAALRYPRNPACVLLTHTSVVHMNTHTIHRFDKNERVNYFGPTNLVFYLREHFAPELRAAMRLGDAGVGAAASVNGTSSTLGQVNAKLMKEWDKRTDGTNCWGLKSR